MKKKLIALLCSLISIVTILSASPLSQINAATNPQQDEWLAKAKQYAANRQGVDQDGMYGAQCVDLVYNYAASIFPIKRYGEVIYGNANELHENANLKYFDKIKYSPEKVEKGDILVYAYRPGAGALGHVVVVTDVYPGGMTVVNQHVNGREYFQIDDCPGYLLWGYGIADYILRPIDMYSAQGGSLAPKITYKKLPTFKQVNPTAWHDVIKGVLE